MVDFSYGIITVSDTCHLGEAIDKSGPKIKDLLETYYNASKITKSTVPDEIDEIEKTLLYYSDSLKLNCIITTGGTGCAQRDVTPEATRKVIQREYPQLATLMLLNGLKFTRFAALTRGICGIRGKTLIINFPGSEKACVECFEAIHDLLPHAMHLLNEMREETKEMHRKIQEEPVKVPASLSVGKSSVEIQQDIQKAVEIPALSAGKSSVEILEDIQKAVQVPALSAGKSTLDVMKGIENDIAPQDSTSEPPKSSTSITSKIKDFSEFLKQSASNMDDAILSGSNSVASSRSSSVLPQAANSMPFEFPQTGQISAADVSKLLEQALPGPRAPHVCPHKTANPLDKSDRNSPYPMIDVSMAQDLIFENIKPLNGSVTFKSPMNYPPFRASLKDGYAVKSISKSKVRKVIGSISAGDSIIKSHFGDDECYKINTGAPIPNHADCIIQVEDTKLLSSHQDGSEQMIELLKQPRMNLDVRGVGADLIEDEELFTTAGTMDVAEKTILASVGLSYVQKMPKIAVISTGDELVEPNFGDLPEGKIYDSNTTMLKLLCQKYGFEVKFTKIAKDDYGSLKSIVQSAMKDCSVIISSGGVSMGDKDYVKPILKDLGYQIHFGRVNVKPGKPMTFATKENETAFFGLPGNPVSAFVTFHLFVLPALRFMAGFSREKSSLPVLSVILEDSKYQLDERPEYVRAILSFDSVKGLFKAQITNNQMSSRIASLVHADVLLHMPSATEIQAGVIGKGWKLKASVIDQFFISKVF